MVCNSPGDRVSLMLCLHHHHLSQLCTAVFATAILVRLGTSGISAVRPVNVLSANSLVQSLVSVVVDGSRVLVG